MLFIGWTPWRGAEPGAAGWAIAHWIQIAVDPCPKLLRGHQAVLVGIPILKKLLKSAHQLVASERPVFISVQHRHELSGEEHTRTKATRPPRSVRSARPAKSKSADGLALGFAGDLAGYRV